MKYAILLLTLLAIGLLVWQDVYVPSRPDSAPKTADTQSGGNQVTQEGAPRTPDGAWSMFRGDERLSGTSDTPLRSPLRLRWSVSLASPVQASPIVAEGRVYLGAESGAFVALRLRDGIEAWRVDLGAAVEASALFHAGTLFVGTTSGTVYALDHADGRVQWTFETGGMVTGAVNMALDPKGEDPVLYVGSHDMHLYALDANRGGVRWSYRAGNSINGTPALAGDRLVLAGCDHAVRVLDTQTGAERFVVDVGSYVPGSPAVAAGMAYVGHYGNEVVAVNLTMAQIAWRMGDRDTGQPFVASPAVWGDHVLVGGRDGVLYNLRAADGGIRWQVQTGAALDSAPVICRETVVIGGMDGRLSLFDLADGSRRFRYDVGAPLVASPAVLPDVIVVVARNGRVLLFESAP